IEGVLHGQSRQRAGEYRPLQTREVMRRKAGLGREAPHRLVSEKEQQKGKPVGEKGAAPTHGDSDQQKREHHPFRLDRDAPPEHHPEQDREINERADQQRAGSAHSSAEVSEYGQQPPPRSRSSR